MHISSKTAVFCLWILLLPSLAGAWDGKVTAVASGDTITVLKDGQALDIRLAALDCPEEGQPFGPEAKKFTANLVANKIVKIWPAGTNRSGQSLAFIFIGDKNLNKELLTAGLAWHAKAYSRDPELAKLEFDARSKKIGLWSQPNPVPPWEWQKN